MADVLLTHSNHVYSDRKQTRKMQPYPPLQTLIAAAQLRACGYSVALYDVTLAGAPEAEFRESLAANRPHMVAVVEDNFNFLTKMCLTNNRETAFRMCAIAHESGIPAVVNGSDSTDRSAAYLEAGFEMVLIGEVEPALEDAARQIVRGEGPPLPRLVERRTPIAEFDTPPDAAWGLGGIRRY